MQEKARYDTGEVTLTLLDVETAKQHLYSAGSVHCFPISNGDVLFTLNPRGIDIIGGHVEKGETAVDALFRETIEEASIEVISYKLIGGIEVDNTNNPAAIAKGYPIKGYQLFFAITEFEMNDFVATHECTGRLFMKPNEVQEKHHNWLKVHQALLNEAIKPNKHKPKI